uniref:Uncharacterized protein n=1 Tax=Tetranychus urticae TaxID=32264 RepID=T1KLX4_TETUR
MPLYCFRIQFKVERQAKQVIIRLLVTLNNPKGLRETRDHHNECERSESSSKMSKYIGTTVHKPNEKTNANVDETCSCPYFIPLISDSNNVQSKLETYIEPFKQIQLKSCDSPTIENQITESFSNIKSLLLSDTVHAEIHPEPCINNNQQSHEKQLQGLTKANKTKAVQQSFKNSHNNIFDSLPNFSPLVKNKIDPNRESKMTVFSIIKSNNNTKPNGIIFNGSLPNGLVKSSFRPSQPDNNSLAEIKLNMEATEVEGGQSSRAVDDTVIDCSDDANEKRKQVEKQENAENCDSRDETGAHPTTNESENVEDGTVTSPDNVSKENVISVNEKSENRKIKNLLKGVPNDKKLLLERRLSGSHPLPDTPDTNESSAPSPDWASKILNQENIRIQNANTTRTAITYTHRYSSIASRAPSITSSYSAYDVPHEKLTDLRKILHPEVEKKDLETVFKAHWETFMDCRCFECTFNNAAKFITVAVLAFTLFLFIRALTNIFRR